MFSVLIKAGTAHLSNEHSCPQEAPSSPSLPAFSFQAVSLSSGQHGSSGVLLPVLIKDPVSLPEISPVAASAPAPTALWHPAVYLTEAGSCNESAHSLHQDPPPVMFYRTSNLKLRAYLIFLTQVQTVALLIFNWPFLGGYW